MQKLPVIINNVSYFTNNKRHLYSPYFEMFQSALQWAANSHGFAVWHTLVHVFTRSHATHPKKKSDFGPRRVRSFSSLSRQETHWKIILNDINDIFYMIYDIN